MKRERFVQPVHLSLCANLSFAGYTGGLGLLSGSWWFITLAAYYIVLSVMRFALLRFQKHGADEASERFVMRFTGALFLVLSVVLAGTTYLAFLENQGVRQHEIVMISMALYAFLKVTIAAINLAKCRALKAPVLKTLRNVSFADALVSIFALQRSMLVSFDGMSADNIALFNALTGSAVYLAVFLLGLNLIGGNKITMAKSKFIEANKKVAEAVTDGYKNIERGVVDGYKKMENGVVEGYTKMEDKFIAQFLTREGESVEDARKRLKEK